MLSLETAKKLKEAGLKWELEVGDFYLQEYLSGTQKSIIGLRASNNEGYYGDTIQTFLPRLDQLLAQIEGRGYRYQFNSPSQYDPKKYSFQISYCGAGSMAFTADSPEEATARALLWILEQEKGAK